MRIARIVQTTLLSLLIVCTTTAYATTYYVSPSGSDSNNGSELLPWKTIDYGVDQLQPGDKLYVRGGTYYEAVTIYGKTTATATTPVELVEYPGETAILDGSNITDGSAVITIGGGSKYVSIRRLTVRNGPGAGIYVRLATFVEILDNEIHGHDEFGINIRTPSDQAWGANNNILVKGNYVYDNCRLNANRDYGSWKQGISAFRADYVTITENDVYQNYGEGIDYILSDHGTITKNEVYDNFSVNIYLDNAQSTKVDSNFVKCGNSAYHRDNAPATGITVGNETYTEYGQNVADGLTISNNIVLRCKAGFSFYDGQYNHGMHNSVIAHNVFYNTTYATIWVRGETVHTNVLVANNIFYQKSNKPYASSDNTTGLSYHHNVWYGGGDSSTIIGGTGDITSDPKLFNAGGGAETDYKLITGSPCINTGTTVSAVPNDYFAVSRSQPDIGIHEF
jgi:parallel beta-helix repeat protein